MGGGGVRDQCYGWVLLEVVHNCFPDFSISFLYPD